MIGLIIAAAAGAAIVHDKRKKKKQAGQNQQVPAQGQNPFSKNQFGEDRRRHHNKRRQGDVPLIHPNQSQYAQPVQYSRLSPPPQAKPQQQVPLRQQPVQPPRHPQRKPVQPPRPSQQRPIQPPRPISQAQEVDEPPPPYSVN